MKLIHRINAFATHQPVLVDIYRKLSKEGAILELGSGLGSTELLHRLCLKDNRKLITVDDSAEWLSKYNETFCSKNHSYIECRLDKIIDNKDIVDNEYELVFIDQGEWLSRFETLKYFKDKARFIILHDSDYYPTKGVFGTCIKPLVPFEEPGIYDYSDQFKYFKEFWPIKPWPAESGAPTLLASNFESVDFDIDMSIEEVKI